MTVRVIPGFDAIHANIHSLPNHGVVCGYTTGSDGTNGTVDIRWRDADWLAHPGAVRICQDASATDHTADMLDVERGAATLDDLGPWVRRARTNFKAVTRPGQREPSIYMSASVVPDVTGRLRKDGILGVGLVVANWSLDDEQATKDVEEASGDFPVVGIQWRSGSQIGKPYDIDVFSVPWLHNVSRVVPVEAGPYLHFTDGTNNVNDIAAARHEGALSLLTYSIQHYTSDDINALTSKVLPAGIAWYSRHP